MDWDDARYFLAVARDGQMLGAARRLGVSQALLSRRIAALEAAERDGIAVPGHYLDAVREMAAGHD